MKFFNWLMRRGVQPVVAPHSAKKVYDVKHFSDNMKRKANWGK